MTRKSHDWLSSFIHYTSAGEAPQHMYFWVGVATIAGALRRRTWIDLDSFQWYPNLYTILVAPPGVVAKSTTAAQGFDLLAALPGITFGPDVTTWQALFESFRRVQDSMIFNGDTREMSCLTIMASELGNFLRPDDTAMIDQLVNIWDGRSIKKETKMDGETIVHNPCLNFIGCTTPSWIAQNFPEYMIGGGFTSRVLFVYAEQKAKYVAYPHLHVPADYHQIRNDLIQDLESISLLQGPFRLTKEATDWGSIWYERWLSTECKNLDETLLGGYINRKQTLVHKIAMCLVASEGKTMTIEARHLDKAVALISNLEAEMPKVYSRIGVSEGANIGDGLLAFIARSGGAVKYAQAVMYVRRQMPNISDFEELTKGLIAARLLLTGLDPNHGVFFQLPGVA